MVYFVILAGGNGQRLWPISCPERPKPLVTVDGRTLLEQTIARVALCSYPSTIIVSTTRDYAQNIADRTVHRIDHLFVEPAVRNTGPAILLSCLKIKQMDPQALVVFVPADSFIPERDTLKFVSFLEHAIDHGAHHEVITLLGIKPTYPATEYGYIAYRPSKRAPYEVMQFREKPAYDAAVDYCAQGSWLWNSGIVCGRAAVIEREFAQHAPDMLSAVYSYFQGMNTYDLVPAIAIDCAVLEKSSRVTVLPIDCSWCDVGTLESFLSVCNEYDTGNRHTQIDADNNLINAPGKQVVLMGVNDVCVVCTDDVLLIAQRGHLEKARIIAQHRTHNQKTEHL